MVRTVKSLYDICIEVAVADCITACQFCKKEFRYLPNYVLFDFYYKMFLEKRLCLLAVEFSDLDVLNRVLSVKHQRSKFLRCFQSLIEHGTHIPEEIIKSYLYYCKNTDQLDVSVIETGLKIGGFFNEGGLYRCSMEILNITEEICKTRIRDVTTLMLLLDCYHKRIYAESIYCEFDQAAETFKSAQEVVRQLELFNSVPNLAALYSNYSFLYFVRSEYDEAFAWSQKAIKLLDGDVSNRIIVEVLRQASKSCAVKRKFNPAGFLIEQAIIISSGVFDIDNHPRHSDTLLDYGFYLLHHDTIDGSVILYERALAVRKDIFQKNNILIALGHEDLAYALYVNEYSSGRFYKAKEHAERSIEIMERILPKDHLLLASVKRVKALILEEIALDEQNDVEIHNLYLQEAEQLHQAALELSLKSFGEKNVQTAKHYGNLGRLYQSMKQYDKAESMHLRAIAIKEELLGSDDYEVGLSTGHLASLYNYHMKRHRAAERLYLRSIKINLKLFGDAYSGLEYDYRGLINVYTKLFNVQMVLHYSYKMAEWKSLREKVQPVRHTNLLLPIEEIIYEYFCLFE